MSQDYSILEPYYGHPEVGIKILVHQTTDFPNIYEDGIALSPGRSYFMGITPERVKQTLFIKQREKAC